MIPMSDPKATGAAAVKRYLLLISTINARPRSAEAYYLAAAEAALRGQWELSFDDLTVAQIGGDVGLFEFEPSMLAITCAWFLDYIDHTMTTFEQIAGGLNKFVEDNSTIFGGAVVAVDDDAQQAAFVTSIHGMLTDLHNITEEFRAEANEAAAAAILSKE